MSLLVHGVSGLTDTIHRAQIVRADKLNLGEKSPSTSWPGRVRDVATLRTGSPFIPAHDISRGIIHGAQSLIHFALMLVVMYVPLRITVLWVITHLYVCVGPSRQPSSYPSWLVWALGKRCSGGSPLTLGTIDPLLPLLPYPYAFVELRCNWTARTLYDEDVLLCIDFSQTDDHVVLVVNVSGSCAEPH